jgi:cytochrome b561
MRSTQRYTKVAVILHWLIGLAIIAMFALGWYMGELPKDGPKQTAFDLFDLGIYTWQMAEPASARTLYFNLHKSLGFTLLWLILFRVYWRISHTPPAMLASYSAFERKLATGAHHLLYLLMVALPLSGVLMTLYSKFGLKWFGMEVAWIMLIYAMYSKSLTNFSRIFCWPCLSCMWWVRSNISG